MNKLMTFATVIAVVSSLMASGSAFALEEDKKEQGRGRAQQGQGMMDWLDEDGDGRVSAEEFPGHDDRFGELDGNSDGFLDVAELEGGRAWNSGERALSALLSRPTVRAPVTLGPIVMPPRSKRLINATSTRPCLERSQ